MSYTEIVNINGNLPLVVTYEYLPAEAGNYDVESPTCCPPSGAEVQLESVMIGEFEVLDILSNSISEYIKETLIEMHDE